MIRCKWEMGSTQMYLVSACWTLTLITNLCEGLVGGDGRLLLKMCAWNQASIWSSILWFQAHIFIDNRPSPLTNSNVRQIYRNHHGSLVIPFSLAILFKPKHARFVSRIGQEQARSAITYSRDRRKGKNNPKAKIYVNIDNLCGIGDSLWGCFFFQRSNFNWPTSYGRLRWCQHYTANYRSNYDEDDDYC